MSQGHKPYRWDGLSLLDDSTSFTQHLWTCCSHYCPCASHGDMQTTASPLLNLTTIWRQVVSFRPQPSHPRGNNPWLCGPQEPVWTFWRREKKNLLPLPGIKPRIVAQSLYHWDIQSLYITPDWSESLILHAKDVSRHAGSFVLFIQSIRCVFLPEPISMINFLVCLQSNYWLSHVFLSCFWNNLTANASICMKIHCGDAPIICQYNPILVKTGQK